MADTNWAELVKPSDVGIERSRGEQTPNPLKGILKISAERNEALQLPVKNGDEAKQITDYLRRDSRESEFGVAIQYRNGRGERVPNVEKKGKGGTVVTNDKGKPVMVPDISKARQVHFQAKPKAARKYTREDIVAWAASNGLLSQDHAGKVPADVRQAFKAANGFTKDDVQEPTQGE